MEWRVLIVDDRSADDIKEFISGRKAVSSPDSISCVLCAKFSEAMGLLEKERFDLVILDLKDDEAPEQEPYAGESVFKELTKFRFIPVIFHTGFAYKINHLVSPYIKVVTKSEWENLRVAIREVFDTKLPKLVRHIEEEQRKYMWETAQKIWTKDLVEGSSSDLAYLLARRLANALSGDVVRSFLEEEGAGGIPKTDKVHAVELYIYPPISKFFVFGDIFKKPNGAQDEYYIALTPSCDHAQKKAEFVLIAKCKYLAESNPGKSAKKSLDAGSSISSTATEDLIKYIRDNSTPHDRYKFLPGTSFIPDLYVDFQEMISIKTDLLDPTRGEYKRIASLDSPFAESLQAKMTRYLGRIGTPDIDPDLAFERFKAHIKSA